MRTSRQIAFVLAWLVIVPTAAYAQASISGVVKDASGSVLPGVSVEAASPELIEKVRHAQTDSTGRASAQLTLGSRAGIYVVEATSPGLPKLAFIAVAKIKDAQGDETHDKEEAVDWVEWVLAQPETRDSVVQEELFHA